MRAAPCGGPCGASRGQTSAGLPGRCCVPLAVSQTLEAEDGADAPPQARKALQELDTLPSVHSVRDMVDTVRYRPDGAPLGPELAAKILLGGIHRGVDAMA